MFCCSVSSVLLFIVLMETYIFFGDKKFIRLRPFWSFSRVDRVHPLCDPKLTEVDILLICYSCKFVVASCLYIFFLLIVKPIFQTWKPKNGYRIYGDLVGNSLSAIQSLTLDRIDKVKHYIRIKTHNTIVLRFWDKNGVKWLICVRPMSYI